MPAFDPFAQRRTALLTTYKRDGTAVPTAVTIAVDGDRAYVPLAHKLMRYRTLHYELTPDATLGP